MFSSEKIKGAKGMNKPHIILIVIDSARVDHFSCYGYGRPTTPFVSSLARESILFDHAVSAGGWTFPAFASIFTGVHPYRLRSYSKLSVELVTLAQALSGAGYRTSGVTWCPFIGPDTELNRGFKDYRYFNAGNIYRVLDPSVLFKFALNFKKHRLAKHSSANMLVTEQARRILERARGTKPQFLFLHYTAHHPYQAPQPFIDKYLEARLSRRAAKRFADIAGLRIRDKDISEEDLEILTGLYDGMLSYIDKCLENLIGNLKKLKIFDDSLIILTSDHGDSLGEHNLLFHTFGLYEGVIRVPLIMKLPGRNEKPARLSHLVQTLDIFPTITKYLGIEDERIRQQVQGESLLDPAKRRAFVVSERRNVQTDGIQRGVLERLHQPDVQKHLEDLIAIRSQEYKFIWSSKGRHQLYNLVRDPAEENNLFQKEPGIVEKMYGMLNEWKQASNKKTYEGKTVEFDGKVKKRLEELGYFC
jgi:arylsulfatase A-like enzyme